MDRTRESDVVAGGIAADSAAVVVDTETAVVDTAVVDTAAVDTAVVDIDHGR